MDRRTQVDRPSNSSCKKEDLQTKNPKEQKILNSR